MIYKNSREAESCKFKRERKKKGKQKGRIFLCEWVRRKKKNKNKKRCTDFDVFLTNKVVTVDLILRRQMKKSLRFFLRFHLLLFFSVFFTLIGNFLQLSLLFLFFFFEFLIIGLVLIVYSLWILLDWSLKFFGLEWLSNSCCL